MEGVRPAPVFDFLSWLHRSLGDVGFALVASVFLLICLALAIGIILWFSFGPMLDDSAWVT